MTITYTIDTWMSIDACEIARRRAASEGWRHIQIMQVRRLAQRQYEVDVLVAR